MDTDADCVSEQGWTIRLRRSKDECVERAQTVGLHAHGLPEFAISALPYDNDPRADMELDAGGMSHVLDQVIAAWRDGPVRAGHPIEVEAYAGWNILIDPVSDTPASPGDGTPVVLLRWKPAPPPPPERVDIGAAAAAALQLDIIALEARIPDTITLRGLERDEVISFGHEQRFGPLTPWVVANARAMLALDSVEVLAARIEETATAVNPEIHRYALAAVAESVLRDGAMTRLRSTSYQLCRRLRAREDWKAEVRERARYCGSSRTWARNYLGELLDRFVHNTLLACALQDVLNERLLLSALGAWNTVISPDDSYAGRRWQCGEATSRRLRDYFAGMDGNQLADAVAALEDHGRSRDAEIGFRLIGSTLVRKASPPPLVELVGPGLRDLLAYRGARSCIDQIARLIAALSEPPDWLEDVDLDDQRERLSDLLGVTW